MVALAAGLVAFFLGHEAPRESASNPHRGDLLAVASGLTWAATIIGLRWLSTRTQDPDASEPALVAGNIMAFLATLPFALPTGATTTTDWAIVIYLGVIQIGLAYVCFSIGMPTPGNATRSRWICSSTLTGSTAGPEEKLNTRAVVVDIQDSRKRTIVTEGRKVSGSKSRREAVTFRP